jgi:uncharacterized protein YjdB
MICGSGGLCECPGGIDGCTSDAGMNEDAGSALTLVSISVTPNGGSVPLGTTLQLTATAKWSDGSASVLSEGTAWSSSDTSVATVSAEGLVDGVTQGTIIVTATDGKISGSTQVTIAAPAPVSIMIAPNDPSVAAGLTVQMTATGTFTDGSMHDITSSVIWSSSNLSVATVSNAGLAQSQVAGTTTITAADGTLTASTTLTVNAAELATIAISPQSSTIPLGQMVQLTARGTFTDGTTQNLSAMATWSSDTTGITVSSTGLVQGSAVGSANITAAWMGVSGMAVVDVTTAMLTSISVSAASTSVPAGATLQMIAVGTFSDGSTHDLTETVTWSASPQATASITSSGLLQGIVPGTVTVTAGLGNVTGAEQITVAPRALVSISITPANASIPLGTSQSLTATGTYTDGTMQDLTFVVGWATSDGTVANITTNGLVHSIGVGTITVSASDNGVSASTQLTVTAASLLSISVTPASTTLAAGLTQQLKAVGSFTDGTMPDLTGVVTWTSSDPTIASVSAQGLVQTVKPGGVTITASYEGVQGAATVTVSNVALESITVTPAMPSVPLGKSLQLTATGNYSDGHTADITTSVTWSSTLVATGTVSTGGLVQTKGLGMTTIVATLGSVAGQTSVTVTQAVVASLAITPPSASIALGNNIQLTATGTYTDGSTKDLSFVVMWSSSNNLVAGVSGTGFVTSVLPGMVTITATDGSLMATAQITVASLVSISVTPLEPATEAGTTLQLRATGTYSDNETRDLTQEALWGSDDTTTASVNGTGLVSAKVMGMVTITATEDGIIGSVLFTVQAPGLVSIDVSPAGGGNPGVCIQTSTNIFLGASLQLVATGTYTDMSTRDLTQLATWAAVDTSVVSLSSPGLVQALSVGATGVTATYSGISGGTIVTVLAPVQIAISGGYQNVPRGTVQQLTAIGTFSDQTTRDITYFVTWRSSDTTRFTVNTPGMAKAVGTPGLSATISASVGVVFGTTVLTVASPNLVSITVTPTFPSLPLGGSVQLTATGNYTDGTMGDLSSTVSWAVSDPTQIAVTTSGRVTRIGGGVPVVTATYVGVQGMAVIEL